MRLNVVMEFLVDLHPDEYRRAMLRHQYAGTPGRRINDFIGWSILILAPLTIGLLLWLAPEALSIWYWPVAILAFAYAFYSTLVIRYQIGKQAQDQLRENPLLAHTHYHVHAKGVKLTATSADGTLHKLFLPWKEITQVREQGDIFLIFVGDEQILIVPKRVLASTETFRALAQQAGKLP